MGLLSDILTYLDTQGLITAEGTDGFINYQPDSPDDIVVVNEYGSSPMTIGLDIFTRDVQVVVRRATDELAESGINAIFVKLVNPIEPIVDLTESRHFTIWSFPNPLTDVSAQ